MEQKVKIVIIGLVGLLAVSIFLILQTHNAKLTIENERNNLKRENEQLEVKVEESLKESSRLEERLKVLDADLARVAQEKAQLQEKFNAVDKERETLVEKMKERRQVISLAPEASAQAAIPEDAYWAGVLKAKKDVEMQLEKIREDLREAQLKHEQLQRDKDSLELEVTSFGREKQDLKRQIEYSQKLMDSIAQELVREKNDKFLIQESVKPVQSENRLLRRHLKSLNNRKVGLEKRITALQKEKGELQRRMEEMDTLLREKRAQIDSLKNQLEERLFAQGVEGPSKRPVELPPIVVRPQQTETPMIEPEGTPSLGLAGNVLAVNKEHNFVIVDVGQDRGAKVDDVFQVYRNNESIASIEVIQTRRNIAACDIRQQSVPIQIGDTVR